MRESNYFGFYAGVLLNSIPDLLFMNTVRRVLSKDSRNNKNK